MQEILHEIGTYGKTWEEMQDVLNLPDGDWAVTQSNMNIAVMVLCVVGS